MKAQIKNLILTTLFTTFFLSGFSQSPDHPKHENHFKKQPTIETENYSIELSDAHAQQAFCLVRLTVKNKTNDFLVINTENILFKFKHGEYQPKKKKKIIIPPYKSRLYTAKVDGNLKFHVESFTLQLDGFSIIDTDVKPISVDKFQIPANKNSITQGNFDINLLKSKQETDETVLNFSCTYRGKDIGLVDPSKIIVTTEKGEWANQNSKSKYLFLKNGDTKKFKAIFRIPGKTLDMQFATMHIDWKDTYKESSGSDLKGHIVTYELDPGLTAGKNN